MTPKKSKTNTPIQATLSHDEMKMAIIKIDRRIETLQQFDINIIQQSDDGHIQTLQSRLDKLLTDIYGHGSEEYYKHQGIVDSLYFPNLTINEKETIDEVRNKVKQRIEAAIIQLQSIKSGFEEDLNDAGIGGSAAKAMKAYQGLELHPSIASAANRLYLDGHYANAIVDSIKALN